MEARGILHGEDVGDIGLEQMNYTCACLAIRLSGNRKTTLLLYFNFVLQLCTLFSEVVIGSLILAVWDKGYFNQHCIALVHAKCTIL
jgi:hypothetical protein